MWKIKRLDRKLTGSKEEKRSDEKTGKTTVIGWFTFRYTRFLAVVCQFVCEKTMVLSMNTHKKKRTHKVIFKDTTASIQESANDSLLNKELKYVLRKEANNAQVLLAIFQRMQKENMYIHKT